MTRILVVPIFLVPILWVWPQPGTFRIVGVGDSSLFGWGVDDDQDTFDVEASYSDGVQRLVGRQTLRQLGAKCLRLMNAAEPCVIEDSATDAGLDGTDRDVYRRMQTRALIGVPVLLADRVVAAMTVHVNVPRAWRADEVQLLRQVATRCWESVDRTLARADAELQKRLLYSLFMQAPTLIAVLRARATSSSWQTRASVASGSTPPTT